MKKSCFSFLTLDVAPRPPLGYEPEMIWREELQVAVTPGLTLRSPLGSSHPRA